MRVSSRLLALIILSLYKYKNTEGNFSFVLAPALKKVYFYFFYLSTLKVHARVNVVVVVVLVSPSELFFFLFCFLFTPNLFELLSTMGPLSWHDASANKVSLYQVKSTTRKTKKIRDGGSSVEWDHPVLTAEMHLLICASARYLIASSFSLHQQLAQCCYVIW